MHFSAEFGDPDISALVDSNIIRPDVLRQDLVGSRADFRHLDPSSGHPHTLQKMSHEGWRRPHVIEVAELRIEYPAAIVLSYPGNRIIVRGEVRRPLIDADAAHIEGSKYVRVPPRIGVEHVNFVTNPEAVAEMGNGWIVRLLDENPHALSPRVFAEQAAANHLAIPVPLTEGIQAGMGPHDDLSRAQEVLNCRALRLCDAAGGALRRGGVCPLRDDIRAAQIGGPAAREAAIGELSLYADRAVALRWKAETQGRLGIDDILQRDSRRSRSELHTAAWCCVQACERHCARNRTGGSLHRELVGGVLRLRGTGFLYVAFYAKCRVGEEEQVIFSQVLVVELCEVFRDIKLELRRRADLRQDLVDGLDGLMAISVSSRDHEHVDRLARFTHRDVFGQAVVRGTGCRGQDANVAKPDS